MVTYNVSGGTFQGGRISIMSRQYLPTQGTLNRFHEENIASSLTTYPVSISGVALANDKLYFVVDYQAETAIVGKAELCVIPKTGGTRTVLKTYTDPLMGPRSPLVRGTSVYYLEGGPVRRTGTDDAEDLYYYPNEGGKLIEIQSDNTIIDHGIIWRSANLLDSPDMEPRSPRYDGWGLHNNIQSNMISDNRNNLHFIAGYGSPERIYNNLPGTSSDLPVSLDTNFVWIQWGNDLATKIFKFPTATKKIWQLLQQLASLMKWEIGFGPVMEKVDAIRTLNSNISEWSANASFFFRPRTILPAKLRAEIGATDTITSIGLTDTGLPAEIAEFPIPPTGSTYSIIINKEIFTYTSVTPDTNGRILTGITRAQNLSTAATHVINSNVYFIDKFISGEIGTTLVSIQDKHLDLVNLFNDITINFGTKLYNTCLLYTSPSPRD